MNRLSYYFLLLSAGCFSVFCAWYFSRFHVEDAFIVSRYARNLAEWGELVYNRGEYINALTSPLHVFIKWICYLLPGDETLIHKLASVAALVLTIGMAWKNLPGTSARRLLLIITLCSPYLWLWTYAGLETPWLGLWLILFTLETVKNSGINWKMALWAGLLMVTRYDMILITLPVMGWRILRTRKVLPAWPAVLLPLLWMGFAMAYYHDIFPTSLYVKSPLNPASFPLEPLFDGIYIFQFLLFSGLALLLLAIGFTAGKIRLPYAEWWTGALLYMGVYGFFAGREHMMFAFRLFIPWLVPVSFLLLLHWPEERPRPVLLLALLLGLQVTAASLMNSWSLDTTTFNEYENWSYQDYRHCFMEELEDAAAVTHEHWQAHGRPGESPALCTFAGGLLPYRLPDFYIYEVLVSYRSGQPWTDNGEEADYYHFMVPKGAPVPLVSNDPQRYSIIWSDGGHVAWPVMTYMVYNRKKISRTLSPYIQ